VVKAHLKWRKKALHCLLSQQANSLQNSRGFLFMKIYNLKLTFHLSKSKIDWVCVLHNIGTVQLLVSRALLQVERQPFETNLLVSIPCIRSFVSVRSGTDNSITIINIDLRQLRLIFSHPSSLGHFCWSGDLGFS